VSQVPTPTTEELEASHFVGRGRFSRELSLPDDFPDRVTRLAEEVAGGEQTPYEQALALQHFLRNSGEFTYDTNVEAGHNDDALERFLFDIQRGYCEQFAVSFAAMARSIGLPTRVAMGFTAGRQDANGVFHVTNKDAHAWPEVWLEGIGWMPFEPTPTRFEPTPGDPTGTGREAPPNDDPASSTTAAPSTTSTTNAGGATATTVNPFRPNNENIDVGGGGATSGGDSTWTRVLLGMGILLALVVLAVVATLLTVLIVKWQRRHRRRHAANPRDRVTGAWAEALDRLREAGVSPRDSATPVEFALRHAAAHGAGSAGPPLMDLARLQTAALFAPEPPSTEEAEDAWQQVGRIEHALRRVTNRSHRWQRRLDPRSLRLSPRTG
jgi:hypothetical protein